MASSKTLLLLFLSLAMVSTQAWGTPQIPTQAFCGATITGLACEKPSVCYFTFSGAPPSYKPFNCTQGNVFQGKAAGFSIGGGDGGLGCCGFLQLAKEALLHNRKVCLTLEDKCSNIFGVSDLSHFAMR